jgi:hypothetical protein
MAYEIAQNGHALCPEAGIERFARCGTIPTHAKAGKISHACCVGRCNELQQHLHAFRLTLYSSKYPGLARADRRTLARDKLETLRSRSVQGMGALATEVVRLEPTQGRGPNGRAPMRTRKAEDLFPTKARNADLSMTQRSQTRTPSLPFARSKPAPPTHAHKPAALSPCCTLQPRRCRQVC